MAGPLGRPNLRSVRFRATAGAVLALVVILATAGFGINWFVGRQVQQSFDAVLLEQATDRAALLSDGANVDLLLSAIGDEAIVVVIDAQGTVVASFGTAMPEPVLGLGVGLHDVEIMITEQDEGPHLEELRIGVAAASSGRRVVVGNENEGVGSTLSAVRGLLLLVIPLVAAAAAVVAWIVTGRALDPVRSMQQDLDRVVHATDGQRVERPNTGDEVDLLGASINDVLDRLDQASMSRRRFVADASHELKSPLANARALIETASGEPDRSEYQRVTSGVTSELNRLHGLVDDLLYLASEDEGAPQAPAAIDIADIAFDEAERVAATSTKTIDASKVAPAMIFADESEVARALRNLIENAERCAHSMVTLTVQDLDNCVVITVADDGPGIPPTHRESIFERFARVDGDRQRDKGGTGLGLSIVASIAGRNKGSVRVTDSPEGGALFALKLPKPPNPG